MEYLGSESQGRNKTETSKSVLSPMPCRVCHIRVKSGDEVKKGDVLMIVEAMKMEHVVKAPQDGEIRKIFYKEGQLVGERKVLVELE